MNQTESRDALGEIDVVPERYSGRGPQLEFHEGDAHTGDNSFWVNAKDQLSLSLLALAKVQGRVIGSHQHFRQLDQRVT